VAGVRDELFTMVDYRHKGALPKTKCSTCGAEMHLNDLEDHYLLFAREG